MSSISGTRSQRQAYLGNEGQLLKVKVKEHMDISHSVLLKLYLMYFL